MPTNAEILSFAPAACVLSGNDVSKGVLFGSRLDNLLPTKIYMYYKVIKKIYDANPNYAGMTACCLYLWEIMGRYGIAAMAYSGSGGSVVPTSGSGGYAYTSLPFTISTDATTFTDNQLIGGTDLTYVILNNQLLTVDNGDFTFANATGLLTFITVQLFIGDKLTISFNKKL